MATVAVFDHFLTLDDEVCKLYEQAALVILMHQFIGQLHVEETKVMDVFCIPPG